MSENDLHRQVIDLIRRAEAAAYERGKADAYERGKADARRELMALGSQPVAEVSIAPAPHYGHSINTTTPARERQRAPKGIVRKFIIRVLADNDNGMTPPAIVARAETEFEKMIKLASVRSELRAGRADGRYRDDNGHWYLVRSETRKEEAGAADNDTPPLCST